MGPSSRHRRNCAVSTRDFVSVSPDSTLKGGPGIELVLLSAIIFLYVLFYLFILFYFLFIYSSFKGYRGRGSSAVERATPGEEVPGSIPAVAARSLKVGSVSV